MPHPTLIVGGICLTGKTTLVRRLIAELGPPVVFMEGDELHTPASIEKMRAGQPLSEADRTEWLGKLCENIAHPPPVAQQVITCSALTRAFRDKLRRAGAVRFVFLVMGRESAEKRAAKRLREEPKHYFQPAKHPALLDGQFRDLQVPGGDEPDCVVLDLDAYPPGPDGPEVPMDDIVHQVEAFLKSAP